MSAFFLDVVHSELCFAESLGKKEEETLIWINLHIGGEIKRIHPHMRGATTRINTHFLWATTRINPLTKELSPLRFDCALVIFLSFCGFWEDLGSVCAAGQNVENSSCEVGPQFNQEAKVTFSQNV